MKKKISLILTFVFVALAAIIAVSGTAFTGFVTANPSEALPVSQIFSAIFLFLGLAIFIVGIMHE